MDLSIGHMITLIYLKSIGDYVRAGVSANFYTVTKAARRKGQTAIGYRISAESKNVEKECGVYINPKKSEMVTFNSNEKIIVIAEV